MVATEQTVIDIQPNAITVAQRVAHWLLELTLTTQDKFSVCLSGGATPKRLYETLAQKPLSDQIPWERIHWFWGDERYVSKDDPLSNFRMVNEAMLSKCSVPANNIHRINTDLQDPNAAAKAYEQELKTYYGADNLDAKRPFFDLVLLGLGADGHTASLFPDTDVLKERVAWVKAVSGIKPEARITLTYPILESSKAVAFLATGRDKRDIVKQVISGSTNYPAGNIRPLGKLFWFLDEAAYPQLT